ncbi:Cleavage induced protein [Phytophthora megakarya]|uniref:Cleavage induced protein n=1 Tax=Phytophthora megakarya TaxID=4795 RepID=A0A225VFP8_9STRA|nr:Cleavage induced protein [Phytophthora megakarya]
MATIGNPSYNPAVLSDFIISRWKYYEKTTLARRRLADMYSESARVTFETVLNRHGIPPPKSMPTSVVKNGSMAHLLDRNKQSAYSQLIRRAGLQLPEFVRLLRSETEFDTRPNKSLEVPTNDSVWSMYQHRSRWHDIVYKGVQPDWKREFPKQCVPPANHGSAKRALNVIIKHLRVGQDTNRYLILDIDLLSSLRGVTCSPFGAVQKGDIDMTVDARIIHDLSYPPGESVNDNTNPDFDVEVSYDGADALANRVLDVAAVFPDLQRMMTGDVNGAFRHIPISADAVGRFAGTIPELGVLIIDLCCPFGWKNSPSSYWIAGAAISYLYSNSAPEWPLQPAIARFNFDAKTWCDDHISIEPDIGSRLSEAHIALRRSMVAILGPDACNDKKFASWFRRGRALGLDWDLSSLTISMPKEKVDKAMRRVNQMMERLRTTRTQLQKLLGSLRHVVTCIRQAAPFFQRVATLARNAPRYGTVDLSEEATDDLKWFALVINIGRLNAIPLSRFTQRQEPQFHINMDASDRGLCALFAAKKEYLQVEFSDTERELIGVNSTEFCINVRELMSAVFASIVWGPYWHNPSRDTDTHVSFSIDNISAVAWNNHKSSRNDFAQLLLRIIGICEVQYGFYTSAVHVAGHDNQMADAGSRVWQSASLAATFSNLSCGWSQVRIPDDSRDLSRLWGRYCAQGRLPIRPGNTTLARGHSGSRGAK